MAAPAATAPASGRPSLEKQLLEHWTGILGAAILVAGVAFIGISVALRMGPFLRTALIAAGAAVLIALSQVLKRRPAWVLLSAWLRSSGAAIFLLACFGASAVPALRWIESLWIALAVLVLGIAANLYVAWAGSSQAFASLHVVLSLIPLAIIPPTRIPLFLATIVTLAGIALALRGRWDRHLLTTLLGFAIFHSYWASRFLDLADRPALRISALACAILVGAAAALVHYREDYRSRSLERLPFSVHLLNWGLMGYAGLIYSVKTPLRGVALITGAVAAYLLARRGREIGVRWVWLTDVLVAQGLAALGILSFHSYVFDRLVVVAILFAQIALFLRVTLGEAEPLFKRAGLFMLHGSAGILVIAGLMSPSSPEPAGSLLARALVLFAAALAGTAIHVWLLKTRGEEFDSPEGYGIESTPGAAPTSILGVLVGMIVLGALACLSGRIWAEAAALLSVTALIAAARAAGSRGLSIGSWIALLAVFVINWRWLFVEGSDRPPGEQLARILPLTALGAAAIALAPAGPLQALLRRLAIYALGFHVAMGVYFVTKPFSPLIPGVAWLVLSLIALEAACRIRGASASATLHVGYGLVAGWIAQYVLVHMQAQSYLGPFRVRMLIEAFGLACLGWWWSQRPSGTLSEERSWKLVHPAFLEIALAFLATAVVMEAPAQTRPILWAAFALLCLSDGLGRLLSPRLRLHALFFFWLAAADLAIVTSGFMTPLPRWFEHPAATGTGAMALMMVWVIRSHRRLGLETIEFPQGMGALRSLSQRIEGRASLWVYYPFAASVAIFLYWRFDKAMLTLLWAVEAFALFVLSAVLRENHFRYLGLAGMGACVVRLIAYDMSQVDTLVRGLVFFGVGALMLSMNTIYNRFRARFE